MLLGVLAVGAAAREERNRATASKRNIFIGFAAGIPVNNGQNLKLCFKKVKSNLLDLPLFLLLRGAPLSNANEQR